MSKMKLLVPETAFKNPDGRVYLPQIKRRLPQFEESSKRRKVGIVFHAHLDPVTHISGLSISEGTGIVSVKYSVHLAYEAMEKEWQDEGERLYNLGVTKILHLRIRISLMCYLFLSLRGRNLDISILES